MRYDEHRLESRRPPGPAAAAGAHSRERPGGARRLLTLPARPVLPARLAVLALAVLPALSALPTGCANGNPGNGNNNENGNNNTINPDGGGQLPLGMNCSFSWECNTQLCLGVGPELICSLACASDPCPEGSYCAHVDVQIAPAGEPVPPSGFYCLPDRGGLCKPCGSDVNCAFAGDRCLDLGGGVKVCGRDCSYDGTCPVGYECRQGQCWPLGDTCDCTAERAGATRSCQNMNEFGVCQGVQTCGAEGWDDCSAKIPSFEVCNGEDDDCDGHLPSDELDADQNGIIDCLENCTPTDEVCNSKDDDCNGIVDDGDPVELCGSVPNGETACLHGECVIGSCESGWVDVDEDLTNGCECELSVSGGENCGQAEVVGPLSDGGGGTTEVRSGILQDGQERWYQVQAVDEPDSGAGACDDFHLRIQFTQNPSNVYKFDVIEAQCQGDAACPSAVTDFQFYTNFRDGVEPNITGECPCSDTPGEGENECTDQSGVYMIRLFREPGAPLTCDPYELEFTNGVHAAPI